MTSSLEGVRRRARSLPVRAYLFAFALAVAIPIVFFAAVILMRYAEAERASFERAAARNARQVARVVDGELMASLNGIRGLAASSNLARGDLAAFHDEAMRYVGQGNEIVVLREFEPRQLFNTVRPFGSPLPPAVPLKEAEAARLRSGDYVVSDVFLSPISGEPRVAVAIPVRSSGSDLILAATIPTAQLRDAMLSSVPSGWTVGVGDKAAQFVTRSERHEEVSGKPASAGYYDKAVGQSGSFTTVGLDGAEIVAGYYWSEFSGWLFGANIPRDLVEAPLRESLTWIGAFGVLTAILSAILALLFGHRFSRAARGLVERAVAFGRGSPFVPLSTGIRELDVIAAAFVDADHALRRRSTELQAVLSTVPAAVWFTYDARAKTVVRNRFAADFMRFPISETTAFTEGPRLPNTVRMQKGGRDLDIRELPLQRALSGEEVIDDEYVFAYRDGTSRIVLISAKPIMDSAGRRIGAVAVGLDITERKRGEEQRRLLVNELNHRVKNTLASVQSIAVQTLRNAKNLEEAAASLQSRLVAFSKAHDVLNAESWEGADLRIVVENTVALHAEAGRISYRGPSVWLPPSLALSLTLVLHELTTNAVKYGALSADGGTVAIVWRVDGEPDGEPMLTLRWTEQGGPAVSTPARQGFGTRLISRLLAAEQDGSVVFDYAPGGLVCTIRARLEPRRTQGIYEMEVAS